MTSAHVDPLIGHTLDERYVIRSRIARGGMAMVYLGNDLRLQRRVAIKIMHTHLADEESFTRRFEQEARSAAGLSHPNVVNVYDQGIDAGLPYLVMEYLPGITLRELLKQQRVLTPEQALEIGEAVLAGLAAAHEAGIVHRDLKPENVLLADDGRIKIGDFGLARAVSANTTTGQALLGTIAYLSPELVTRGIADARSDLYAFGIMLFEMLTGQQPFQGEQPMQIAYQHAHSDVPLPSSLNGSITAELDELVRWTTGRDPDSRPSDAREALEYLRRVRQGGSLAATSILPATSVLTGQITPSTSVLSSVERDSLAGGATGNTNRTDAVPATAIERARRSAKSRAKRGRWTAAILALLILVAGGAGWWWGQGPGSRVTIPEVTGLTMSAAQALLEEHSLQARSYECASLTVEAGLASHTDPGAGTRVERGGVVRICESTGPQLLPVPTLVGLSLEDAQRAIEDARFTFGSVVAERFDGGTRDTVILALNTSGEGLGDTYPEQGVIDLIVSAGSMPEVSGLEPSAAKKAIEEAGLTLDESGNTTAHHDSIPVDRVIRIVTTGDSVDVGDAVSLQISLGPELFDVPDVDGQRMSDAIQILKDAGFTPVTDVPEALWRAVRVEGTKPKAGEKAVKGATIRVLYER